MTFTVSEIPNLKGKIAIVTVLGLFKGANTGIGKPTALELAKHGAHVFLACRSSEKTLPVVEEIKKESGNEKVEFLELDLSKLESVKHAAEQFKSKNLKLNILVNNAGIMMLPKFEQTVDGFEKQWGTNFLGHFYFTKLLLPVIEKSAPARIVNVSSSAHRWCPDPLLTEEINDPKCYGSARQYGVSKGSNVLFSIHLNEYFTKKGIKNIWVNSVHPGVINTELTRNMGWFVSLLKPIMSWVLLTPEQGALTQLYVATHPDIEEKDIRAQYFVPTAKLSETTKVVSDKETADKLCSFAEKILKEKNFTF